MNRILLALPIAALILVGCSSGTTTSPTTGATSISSGWTPAQDEWFELLAATSAENIAAAVKGAPGLSPADIADVKTGMIAVSNTVQAQAAVLGSGGSLTAQAEAGTVSIMSTAITSLGTILSASHGATATTAQIAAATGIDALAQLPALISAFSTVNGHQPAPSDIQTAIAALNSAAAQ